LALANFQIGKAAGVAMFTQHQAQDFDASASVSDAAAITKMA
jgi:hypothetical protein